MSTQEALIEIPQRYRDIVEFMEGVQSMELIDEEKKLDIRKNKTENHWVYHFLIPSDSKDETFWNSNTAIIYTFGIYFHMFRDEVVVKSSIKTGDFNSEKNMLYNNLNDEIRKLGFKHISFDNKVTRQNYQTQTFIKILFNKDKTLEDMHNLYELMKKYNNELRDEWITKARSNWR